MTLTVKKNLIIVLTVNVYHHTADFFQHSRRGRPAVYTCHTAAVSVYFTGYRNFPVIAVNTKLCKLFADLGRKLRKKSRYNSLITACTDNILTASLSENSVYSVNKYGFTCTCFACENIKPFFKRYGSFTYYRQIFDIKLL